MKMLYRLTAFALAIIIAAAGFVSAAAYGNDAKLYEEGIIEYNLQKSSADSVQEWIDGALTLDAGAGSEWYIIALSNHGKYDFSAYNIALNGYLSQNEVGSASSRLKYALTYVAIGDKANPYINNVLDNSIGEQGIMSLAFGLHLLNNGYICDTYSVNALVEELLSLQLADGGFSVTGEYGDVDVTAMTVQALAAYYNENPDVKFSVDRALDFLSVRQLDSGGYAGYGVANPESAAQVVIALSSLGIDACEDNRFIKNGNTAFDGMSSFLLADGSFCHKEGSSSDSMATAQVLSASIAYKNMKNGKSPFYIFNENETVSEKKTTTEITTETSAFAESTLKTANTLPPESIAQSEESAETRENKTDSVRFIIVFVCVISALLCAVLLVTKKHKFILLVIVAAAAVIALTIGISDDNSSDTVGSVTVSISCEVIKNEDKSYIPENGFILEKTKIDIKNGETVYDVFAKACKDNGILFSANMGYIEGINNIYEMDFGKSSGWIYFVNGKTPSVGCGSYELSHGDEIEWHYTRDMGKDLDFVFEKEYN